MAITASAKRHAHVGAANHTRYQGLDLGLDVVDRLCGAASPMETFGMTSEETMRRGLLRELWLYVAAMQLLPPAAREAAVREAPR